MIFGYGKETIQRTYPDGSMELTENAIRNGEVVSTKTVYQHQVRVNTEEEILSQFIKFRAEHKKDGTCFEFKNTPNGNRYIVKVWKD